MKKLITLMLVAVGLSFGTKVIADNCADPKDAQYNWEHNIFPKCYGDPDGTCQQGVDGNYMCFTMSWG